ncbi:MAG: SpoIIE family protein phosphatase [Planctomycetota bacterium]
MAFLSTVESSGTSSRFEIDQEEMSIGRHPDCDIVVEAGAVSRLHARLRMQGNDVLAEDAGSRNGTFVNGRLLSSPHVLREGDRIRISDIELIYHHDEVPAFMDGGSSMSFDGSNFGIVMVDEQETSTPFAPQVEYASTGQGLKMNATPEAKLAALTEINRRLTGALSLDEVLPKVLESLFDIFPAADRGFVVMQDDDDNLIPTWVKLRREQSETETVRISRTIIRKVMESGDSILSLDAMDDSRFNSAESIADFSIRSMICAPLHDGDGNAIGALQIDSTRGHGQFREEDVDLLSGVAAQAGAVINNARLHEQALQQREVEQDLKLATDVQRAFLPQEPPSTPFYRVASFYKAANHIGGDYYDYIHLPGDRIAIVVADVVGHGVAAAMYMAKLSAETRFCLASDPDVARAIARLNDRMSDLHVERFVTFLMVVIDSEKDMMTIVNAGHMPPIIRRCGDGEVCEPGQEESGLPIAIMEGMDYQAVQVPVQVGDVAILYTDGVNEAMDVHDEEFGIDPIRKLTAEGGDAEIIKDRIVERVFDHIGKASQFDDMCLVVLERIEPQFAEPDLARTVDPEL